MPFVGDIIPPRLTGAPAPAREADRARERRKAAEPEHSSRGEDEAELSSASAVDSTQAVRSVKGNAEQESHQDRTEHRYYAPGSGGARSAEDGPGLDVSG